MGIEASYDSYNAGCKPQPRNHRGQTTMSAAYFRVLTILGVVLAFVSGVFAEQPRSGWREFLWPHIAKLSKKIHLQPLSSEISNVGFSNEIRVWILQPDGLIYGYILQNEGSDWIGKVIRYKPSIIFPLKVRSIELGPPGELLWQDLVRQDIFNLPDADDLADQVRMVDGPCVIVEVAAPGKYRIYHYSNPGDQKWKHARKIEAIVSILETHLGK